MKPTTAVRPDAPRRSALRRSSLIATTLLLAACGDAREEPFGDPPNGRDAPAAVDTQATDRSDATAGTGVAPDGPREEEASDWTRSTVSGPEGEGYAVLREVRIAAHDGYDRVVFEFEELLPGYQAGYVPSGDLVQCGSGRPIDPGAPNALVVDLSLAHAHDEDGRPTVADRDRRPGLTAVRTVRLTCDYEAEVQWVLGTERQAEFRAFTLASPSRIVVDVRHR